jgi:hypothetical protein
MSWRVAAVWLAAMTAVTPAWAQTLPVDVSARLSGRLQYQFNTTNVAEGELAEPAQVAASTFEMRRLRVAVNLRVDDWITAVIEPDYSLGNLQTRNAWVNFAIDSAFEVRAGQFKKPFSLIQLSSSLEYAAIERGLRIRSLQDAYASMDDEAGGPVLGTFDGDVIVGEEQELLDRFGYMGYEQGAMVHGRLGEFGYSAGVFNGSGPDRRDDNDGKSLAGRILWNLPTTLPVVVAGAVSYHEVAGEDAEAVIEGTAFSVDLEVGGYRRAGVHVIAEGVVGDNLGADERFVAGQAVLSFYRPITHRRLAGIEPLGRISWGDPNREIDGDEGLFLTPGVNLHLPGRTRLQLNWDVFVPGDERFETKHALRAQAQVAW